MFRCAHTLLRLAPTRQTTSPNNSVIWLHSSYDMGMSGGAVGGETAKDETPYAMASPTQKCHAERLKRFTKGQHRLTSGCSNILVRDRLFVGAPPSWALLQACPRFATRTRLRDYGAGPDDLSCFDWVAGLPSCQVVAVYRETMWFDDVRRLPCFP